MVVLSNYVRCIATDKYMAIKNNIERGIVTMFIKSVESEDSVNFYYNIFK